MENLKNKTDAQLVLELKSLHGHEVEIAIECLRRLVEVAKRGVALDRGYSSLHDFARKELKYNKNEAYIRVRASELFALDPSIETHMRDYRLSLTFLMTAQVTFLSEAKRRKEAKLPFLSVPERIAVVQKIASESVKDAKRVLAESFPDLKKDVEATKPLKDGRTQITLSISAETLKKCERMKDLTARKNFDRKWEPMIEIALDFWLAHNDDVVKAENKRAKEERKAAPVEEQAEFAIEIPGVTKRKRVPARIRRQNFERAGTSCQWVDEETGTRCCSTHGLDHDHIVSPLMGGTSELSNLRVLCRAHNSHAARRNGVKQKKRQPDGSLQFEYPSFRKDGETELPH